MNRETVNMVRSPISVEGNIRLVPYYPAYDTALAWYQDAQLCKQVDNRDFVYDLPLLKRMYHYLDTHGELFYIEYRGVLCGDVSLRTTGELAIVICKEYQNKHIGRKVIEKMLELARERGLAECFAHIYSFNTQSQKMFESIGFVPQDEEHYIYKLQKGEPTMTKLTLEEKQELIRMALAARERAYTPYSDFMVGANPLLTIHSYIILSLAEGSCRISMSRNTYWSCFDVCRYRSIILPHCSLASWDTLA